jgi:hypothetical protein
LNFLSLITKDIEMRTISHEDFEELVAIRVEETGLPEEQVRRDAELVLNAEGYVIRGPDVWSPLPQRGNITLH